MSAAIKAIYRRKGIAPPVGKGIHTQKFHEMATSIKQDSPELSMKSAYAIAMSKLGRNKAVKKPHQRSRYQRNK